ncbi:phosphatase PAP2 family protein [Tsukamurella sp. 1534]|uniref:phosphatase PAP2 family protein n=1 Tax=Tsukamurella sp. 1534 TaxID=1151061 RepID=UPI0002E580DE|nr:phosphatase PAP2 family protein [Tsukamurella sp. 1534]
MYRIDRPLIAAALSALAFAMLYLGAVGTPVGQFIDQEVMNRVSGAAGVDVPTRGVLGDLQVPILLALAVAAGAVVLARHSLRVWVEAFLTLGVGVVAAVALKVVLPRPELGVGPLLNSFPSNTVAAVAVIAVAATVAARAGSSRAVVALTMLGPAVVVSVAVVAQQWHRPADVLGAWLLAGFSAALARVLCLAADWVAELPAAMTAERRRAGGRPAAHRG